MRFSSPGVYWISYKEYAMHIIFDFDGTIADTSPGILSCLAETFV
ncbi:MAG: HAD hydrolase-like protein [Clostridia bacterium]|nr:HAD hydrolase-like protein [Clostridia bacterium]